MAGTGQAELRELDREAWPDHLRQRSGLLGPRANLELVQAAGEAADFDALIETGEEYLVLCGVVGLGKVLAEAPDRRLEERLRHHAADQRWRIREGVAMALQRLGDVDPVRMLALAGAWASDPDPNVQRAAVAGVCEPRLLKNAAAAAAALRLCAHVTETLAARPADQRRTDPVRALRKALGYCWSVAIAAAPEEGLPLFHPLGKSDDQDIAWIVRENLKKARLAKLLP